MSDMAPNMSGMTAVDQPRAMYLAELALAFAVEWLKPGGDFLVKVFQGEGFDPFLAECRAAFNKGADPQTGRLATAKPRGLPVGAGTQGAVDWSRRARSPGNAFI